MHERILFGWLTFWPCLLTDWNYTHERLSLHTPRRGKRKKVAAQKNYQQEVHPPCMTNYNKQQVSTPHTSWLFVDVLPVINTSAVSATTRGVML
jgi:hypothetical protein